MSNALRCDCALWRAERRLVQGRRRSRRRDSGRAGRLLVSWRVGQADAKPGDARALLTFPLECCGGAREAVLCVVQFDRLQRRRCVCVCFFSFHFWRSERNQYGVYSCRFFHNGHWEDVFVDDFIPMCESSLLFHSLLRCFIHCFVTVSSFVCFSPPTAQRINIARTAIDR